MPSIDSGLFPQLMEFLPSQTKFVFFGVAWKASSAGRRDSCSSSDRRRDDNCVQISESRCALRGNRIIIHSYFSDRWKHGKQDCGVEIPGHLDRCFLGWGAGAVRQSKAAKKHAPCPCLSANLPDGLRTQLAIDLLSESAFR
jgi:hypothetical protein